MKVLVFGGYGWIGQQVCALLKNEGVEFAMARSRADNVCDVKSELVEYGPTHVISLVGRTHGDGINTIDYLEQPGKLKENVRDNLMAPIALAILCSRMHIHFTYVGTGCIFNELNPLDTCFSDDDTPNFFGSSYSIVKGYTDQLMHMFDDYVLCLRVRMPITNTHHPRSFITKILGYDKICSMPNSMTVLPEMLPIMVDMMKRKICGTYNFTNPGAISHNEILQMYKELVDPQITWTNFSVEEQSKVLASKRSNCQFNTDKLTALYPNVKHIQDAVRECVMQMIPHREQK